jgi:TPR repeat protein
MKRILAWLFLLSACLNAATPPATTTLDDLRAKADAGDSKAQFSLGEMYSNGKGVTQNFDEAIKWYRKAADQGDAYAQLKLQ